MREKLKEFYEFSEGENLESVLSSDNTLFVFDTNSLLELYSINFKHAKVILDILKSVRHKIWIPYQVGFEFQKNRLTKIIQRRKEIRNHIDNLNNLYSSIQKISDNKLFKYDKSLVEKIKKTNDLLSPNINEIKSLIEYELSNSINVRSEDYIRSELDTIFCGDRIGEKPTVDNLKNIIKEAEERFEKKNCPGYKDDNKKDISYYYDFSFENKYGDFLIFNELREKVKSFKDKRNLVFITYDTKEDWWEIVDHEGKKPIGPAVYIKQELLYSSESVLKNLVFLTLEDFIDNLPDKGSTETSIKENVVEELRENTSYRFDKELEYSIKSKLTNTERRVNEHNEDLNETILDILKHCPQGEFSNWLQKLLPTQILAKSLLRASLFEQNEIFERFKFPDYIDFIINTSDVMLAKLICNNIDFKESLLALENYIRDTEMGREDYKFIKVLNKLEEAFNISNLLS